MPRFATALLLLCIFLTGCLVKVRDLELTSHSSPFTATRISTPVKAHLIDGTTVVYLKGVAVTDSTLDGPGERFDLRLAPMDSVTRIRLDSVAAFESFREGMDVAPSVALTLLGTAGGFVLAVAGAVAVFGSCPTIYADSAGAQALQGEAFSYSIAPLFEMRDVDKLFAAPDANGMIWLSLKNEALETHYINHLELLQVQHARDEVLLPTETGHPVLIGALTAPLMAADALGRDVRAALQARDTLAYRTAPAVVDQPDAFDYRDHIDLTFDVPPARDTAGLVLRVRNSLLNTVLFYDVMLGMSGARSVDWLGGTLEAIGTASEMASWYSARTGIRVSVWRDGAYHVEARMPDVGPIADKDVVLLLPTGGSPQLRVRLEFLADSWRIDQVALAGHARRAAAQPVSVHTIASTRGSTDTAAVTRVAEPDERYLQTNPGTELRIGFAPPQTAAPADSTFSYLVAAQGYYTEWVRADWVRNASVAHTFVPGDDALAETFTRWRAVRHDFENRFFKYRVASRYQ